MINCISNAFTKLYYKVDTEEYSSNIKSFEELTNQNSPLEPSNHNEAKYQLTSANSY